MKVPVVIYGNSGRQVIGEVDVYAKDWIQLPKQHQLDLDLLVLSDQVEFVFHIRGQGANPTAEVNDAATASPEGGGREAP